MFPFPHPLETPVLLSDCGKMEVARSTWSEGVDDDGVGGEGQKMGKWEWSAG